MPKRLSKQGRNDRRVGRGVDVNQLMHALGEQSTKEADTPTRSEISRIMAVMGSKGGKKSAKARMTLLTSEERSNIALNAAKARWAKKQHVPIGNASKLK